MPGLSGLDLQNRLAARINPIPLILITGYADIDLAVSAMKAGAHDFIGKPIEMGRLVPSLESAIANLRRKVRETSEQALLVARIAELGDRHRQVLELVVQGLTSKQIASALDINHRTVENYRAYVMERIGVGNIAQLVRVMIELEAARRATREDAEPSRS